MIHDTGNHDNVTVLVKGVPVLVFKGAGAKALLHTASS